MTPRLPVVSILLLCSVPGYARAETLAEDTTRVVSSDSIPVTDSLARQADTLTEAQRKLLEFEERYRQNQLERAAENENRFSFFDSLAAYFLPHRLDESEQIKRGIFGDAGDYFKSRPAFFGLDFQETPMRQTVQPFGLSGERLNLIHSGVLFRPFEHVPEPNGLYDLNDIPTALDDQIYIVPGAVGGLFGGENATASLITLPKKPESEPPVSALIVDKGSFGYSYARGRYSNRFSDNREIYLSVGYRNGNGAVSGLEDDSKNLFSKLYVPLRKRSGIAATVLMYDRDGSLAIRPDSGGSVLHRDRSERLLRFGWFREEKGGGRGDIGYVYASRESKLGLPYGARFLNTSHGGYISREWSGGNFLFKAQVEGAYNKYEDGGRQFERLTQNASLTVAQRDKGDRFAFRFAEKWVEEFGVLPSVHAVYELPGDQTLLVLSAGYAAKVPGQHLLQARDKSIKLYGTAGDYFETSNPNLEEEKQIVGSAEFTLGSGHTHVGLSVTGGRIHDGIDYKSDSSVGVTTFGPVNGDIDFASVSARSKLRLNGILQLSGGGAYNFVEYSALPDRAYTPEYHAFAAGEIHIYWRQKLVHLHAYGEIVYDGPYRGYSGRELGNHAVANAKLSIRMGRFRFHYVFQNVFQRVYEPRERFAIRSRYTSYGIVWDFLD